jgi:hypothetical protein
MCKEKKYNVLLENELLEILSKNDFQTLNTIFNQISNMKFFSNTKLTSTDIYHVLKKLKKDGKVLHDLHNYDSIWKKK